MSNQTFDFSSILENAWNATWNLESHGHHSRYDDDPPKDMNNPSAARNFLLKLGLISTDPHGASSYRRKSVDWTEAIENCGLLGSSLDESSRHRSLNGQYQSHDNAEIISRDDQLTFSLGHISICDRNISDSSTLSGNTQNTLHEKFDLAVSAVRKGIWDIVLQSIQSNPEILAMRSLPSSGQTLLHIALSQNHYVPEKVITVMLSTCPKIIYAVDAPNYFTALHYAALHALHSDLLPILLSHWKDGASQANIDGNLPLHIAALGGQRTELNALVLMGIFPQAAGFMNRKGQLPLHMACSQKESSHVTVFKLLEIHHIMNIPIDLRDQEGRTPMQRAVKCSASNEVLSAFKVYHKDTRQSPEVTFVHSDSQTNFEKRTCAEPDSLGLQVILENKGTDAMIVTGIHEKMPLRLGSVSADGFSKIIFQGSTNFWWSVATDTSGVHFDLVEQILSKFTTFSEVIALAKITGPDGERIVFDAAHPTVIKMITDNLILCESYELHLRLPDKSDGLITYKAALHGLGDTPEKMSSSPSTAAIAETGTRGVLIHCTRINSDRDKEMLREIEMRQKLSMDQQVFQSIINQHMLNGRRFGCPNDQVRLVVLERPYLTLANVLEKHRFRKRRNNGWLRKCRNVLKQVARILQCLHDSGYVHGWLAPEIMAKFGDSEWKLMKANGVKHKGDIMDGEIRSCIPPESITEITIPEVPAVASPRSKSVSFKDDNTGCRICDNSSSPSCVELAFVPNNCLACTSWDTWGFGLVMGQLLLGSSAVNLPNFDRDVASHLKRLFYFDYKALEIIKVSMAKYAGDNASDLVGKLLEPMPHKRLKNMKDILLHSYFTEDIGHFTV